MRNKSSVIAMSSKQKGIPSLQDIERAERLRKVIEELNEINRSIPIIVEGKKDSYSLRSLGIEGKIIPLHNGKTFYDFCEEITREFLRVVLLLDWDKKGEELNKILSGHLNGHWEEFASFREILKILCQKDINDIEGIPKLLKRLEGYENPW